MHKIQIAVGDITLNAELNDSATSKKAWVALPIEASANVWGDEIYFESPVNVLGKLKGDPSRLKGVRSGARVRISAVK